MPPTAKLSPNADNVLLGKGQLLFAKFNASGVADKGYFHLGNCDSFETGLEDDSLTLKSSQNKSAATYKKVTRERKVRVNIAGHEYSKQNFSVLFMGTISDYIQAATAVVDEVLTSSVTRGSYYQAAKRKLTAITVEKGPAPGTAMVLNTDYKVIDAEAGIIQILETAPAVVNGDSVIISYTPTATVAGDVPKIALGKDSKVEGSLLFLPDPQTGPSWDLKLWVVSFTPEGLTGLISDDFAKWTLAGESLDDSAGVYGGSAAEPFGTFLNR